MVLTLVLDALLYSTIKQCISKRSAGLRYCDRNRYYARQSNYMLVMQIQKLSDVL